MASLSQALWLKLWKTSLKGIPSSPIIGYGRGKCVSEHRERIGEDVSMRLRIATFNLENLDDKAEQKPKLAERIQVMRPQLIRLDADVLCLQEVHGQEEGEGLVVCWRWRSYWRTRPTPTTRWPSQPPKTDCKSWTYATSSF